MSDNEAPSNLCVDLTKVDAILRAAALAVAMETHTSMRTENVSNPVLDGFIAGISFAICPIASPWLASYARHKLTDVVVVDTNYRKMMDEADRLHEVYRGHVKGGCDNGTVFQRTEELRQIGYNRWQALQDKFSEARRINNAVTDALSSAYDATHRVKVAADVGMLVLGAVVPIGWVANTAIGVGYSISCKFASSMSECGSTDMVSYKPVDLRNDATGAAFNYAETVADNYGEALRQARAKEFVKQLQAKAEAAGAALARRFDQLSRPPVSGPGATPVQNAIARAGMGQLTAAQQGRLLSPLAQEAISADKAVQAAQRAALPRAGLNGVEAVRNAPTTGAKVAVAGVRVGAVVVGLWFMREELAIAWEGATAHEERLRRERRAAAR